MLGQNEWRRITGTRLGLVAKEQYKRVAARAGKPRKRLVIKSLLCWLDGPVTIVVLNGIPGMSRCNPQDDYNLSTGINQAINRAVHRLWEKQNGPR